MPTAGSTLKFDNYYKQIKSPFAIYADFEAVNESLSGPEPNPSKSFTHKYQKHSDCGYAYKLVCSVNPEFTKPVKLYRGPDAVYKFIESVLEEVKYCKNVLKNELVITYEDLQGQGAIFDKEGTCFLCDTKVEMTDGVLGTNPQGGVLVTCPLNGEIIVHKKCNYRFSDKIPVFFHNLRGYDGHFIMQSIGKFKLLISVIPNNMEKYMAFMLGKHLVFLDSFQYMASSLDNLANNLKDPAKSLEECYPFLASEESEHLTGSVRPEGLSLLTRKGVYPYDYMNSFSRFEETKLPPTDAFCSTITESGITESDYNHAVNVWNTFKCKNLGDYHDLYLKTDVLLLTDVFENFRETCMKYYNLDPCHYFTSPGLSWDACLRMTKVTLQLLSNVDMYQFVEKGLRGGVSYIAHRYAKANNKYLPDYKENEESSYITYLDANNLYGWAMSQRLPEGQFKWLTQSEIDKLNLGSYSEDSPYGFILEVDLDYPSELHKLHNDYPLAPEQVYVELDELPPYCKSIQEKLKCSVGTVKKLIPNLKKKEKYVVHYRNLNLYMDLGIKVAKVHKVLKFKQTYWLKEYIMFNTEKRKQAKNEFEKDFFKLMNNSVFGKTMENLRKRIDVKLITNKKALVKWASRPSYVSSKIFNENLVAIHRRKACFELNRPTYVGMCILDLSKY